MQKYTKIALVFDDQSGEKLYQRLLQSGLNKSKYSLNANKDRSLVEWEVSCGDVQHDALVQMANNSGASTVVVDTHIEYSEDDRESAAYLVLGFRVPSKGDTGISFGRTYALQTGCPRCGCGARQTSPLRISSRALPAARPIAQSYIQHLMVHEDVAQEIGKAVGCWDNLRHVEDVKTLRPLPWFQLFATETLPKMSGRGSPLVPSPERICKMCQRSGYVYAGSPQAFEPVVQMERKQLSRLPHIVQLWETAECWLSLDDMAQPPNDIPSDKFYIPRVISPSQVCISQTIYQVFKALNLTSKLHLVPVQFVDD